jgi:LCCL domain-containing protein
MLRSAAFSVAVLVLAACSGGTAPPSAPPSGGPTAGPTQTAVANATTAPTAPPGATPTSAPTTGTTAELCGTDWTTSAATCGGDLGDQFLFQCPPGGRDSGIYGTDTYTNDSLVCVAAVHAGLISIAAGGSVTIQLTPGLNTYVASTRNGVASSSWGSWPASFVFVGGTAVAPTPSPAPSAAAGTGYGANTLLFSDDFSDTSGGWATDSGPSGTIAYESEKLAVDLAADVSYISTSGPIDATPWDVVRIEATLTATGGDGANYAGLLCGASAEDAAGAVVGTDGVHAFIQRTGTNYTALEVTQGVAGSLFQNDVAARLTLECAGTSTGPLRLRLSFDGTLVDEYSGTTGPQNFQTASAYVEGKTGSSFTLDDVSVFGGFAAGLPPLATGDLAELLAHVPAAFNVNCHEVTTFAAGEVIAASCTPDIVSGYVTYTLFETDGHASDAWLADLDFFGNGVTGSDCAAGPCLVAYVGTSGLVEGRYFSNNYTGVDPNGLIAYWFDAGEKIEAGLTVYDTTFAELYDLALQAGPIH